MSDETKRDEPGELMDHEYDGIQEYDNPLPRWWVQIFWFTTIFAAGYFVWYHLTDHGTSLIAAYHEETGTMAPEPGGPAVSEEALAKTMEQPGKIETGKGVYQSRCVPCHGDRGQGIVGPNLTDTAWLHGQGRLVDIHQVVTRGVLDKGMPAWSKQLSNEEITDVVAYVGTMRGTNVPGKPPEGKAAASH